MQISFSQTTMFWTCPRTWYHKYILKTSMVQDLVYANRGQTVHKTLEQYYPKKNVTVQHLKCQFNKYWLEYNLDDTILKLKKDETWLMILNAINLDLDITQTELKIEFDNVKGFIDIVNDKTLFLGDWKTSTRSEHNETEYKLQLKFYSYLYYRKFGVIPNNLKVYYLKYSGTKSELSVKPNIQDINNAEMFVNNTIKKMLYYINNPNKLPQFNQCYNWSPYKHLWSKNMVIDNKPTMIFNLTIHGNYVYIKSDLEEFLVNHIDNKFSYEIKDDYYIKQHCQKKFGYMPNTTKRFLNKKYMRLDIGFLNQLKKTLTDYAEFNKHQTKINVSDTRQFNKIRLVMPDNLLSDKMLRQYQLDAITQYLKPDNKISMLQLATGAGKSLIITEIIRQLKMVTLFVIDKKELLYQMKQDIETELGIDVGVIGDGICDIKPVTVATIQSLTKDITKYYDYLCSVRLVVFDECHHISSKMYSELCHQLKNTEFRLSVSATARRNDGNEMVMQANGGDIVYSIDSKTLIQQGYLMNPKIVFVKVNNTIQERLEFEQKSLTGLINETPNYTKFYPNCIMHNTKRNNIIKNIVNKHSDKSILILIKLVEHGKILNEVIPNSKYIHGTINTKLRDKLLKDFKTGNIKILISTINIFAEGVNIPSLDIIINATGNKGDIKTVQVLGRVLRKNSDKESALYYDFIDNTKFFSGASNARINTFIKEGFKITKIDDTEMLLT